MKKQLTTLPRASRAAASLLAGAMLLAACSTGTPAASNTAANNTAANTGAATEAATEAAATSGDATAATTDTVSAGAAVTDTTSAGASGDAAVTAAKVNVNTATEEELLAAVPNLGENMLHEFMEYRPYASIQEFRQEIGKYVDEAQVAEYEQYIFVPVSPNDADEATLQQIPGVTAELVAQLVAGRPYASDAAFLEALGQVLPADQAAGAAAYLGGE